LFAGCPVHIYERWRPNTLTQMREVQTKYYTHTHTPTHTHTRTCKEVLGSEGGSDSAWFSDPGSVSVSDSGFRRRSRFLTPILVSVSDSGFECIASLHGTFAWTRYWPKREAIGTRASREFSDLTVITSDLPVGVLTRPHNKPCGQPQGSSAWDVVNAMSGWLCPAVWDLLPCTSVYRNVSTKTCL